MRYREGPKRFIDVVGAGVLFVVTLPLTGVVAIAVKYKLGSPVLFRQRRTGLNERDFEMLKFRTMTDARDAAGELLADEHRLTPFGVWLRKTSLDELPELVNVLSGDMSLVGPRPLPTRYTTYFSHTERRRFHVRPGITGLAQVSGRNDMSWTARFAADVEYVDNCSLRMDLRILWRTITVTVKREGLLVDPGAHMLDLDVERSPGRSSREELEAEDA